MKLLPYRRVLCTPYNHAPCHVTGFSTGASQQCHHRSWALLGSTEWPSSHPPTAPSPPARTLFSRDDRGGAIKDHGIGSTEWPSWHPDPTPPPPTSPNLVSLAEKTVVVPSKIMGTAKQYRMTFLTSFFLSFFPQPEPCLAELTAVLSKSRLSALNG